MPSARSPAPKPPRRRWPVVVGVLSVLVVFLGLAAASIPLFAVPYAEAQVAERIGHRLKVGFDVEDVAISWGHVNLVSVRIGGGDGEPTITLDRVEVTLDEDAMWSGVAEVTGATIHGGLASGTLESFQDLVRRIRSGRKPGAKASSGRVKVRPQEVHIEGLALDVTDGDRRVRAKLDASIDVAALRVVSSAEEIHFDNGDGAVVLARSISATLQADKTDEGYSVRFPQRVEVRGVAAPIDEGIAVAGVDGWIEVSDGNATEISLDLAGAFGEAQTGSEGEKLWSVAGRVRRDFSKGVLRVDMDAFEVARVPKDVVAKLPLVESDNATVGGHLAVVFGDGVAALEGDLSLQGFGVSSPTLSRQTVRDLGMDVSFAAEVDPVARRAVLHYIDVERMGVKLTASAVVEHPDRTRGRRYDIVADIPNVACQSVLDAVPEGFAPGLDGFRLGGDFGAHVTLHVDFADLETLALGGLVDMEGCEVRASPLVADQDRLASGFTHQVLMNDGGTASVQMFPGARGFASIRQISPVVTAAIRTTEDGGFWKHNGFMPSQFEVALRRNLAAGRVRLGASTITMQMVKNILLGHERTLSRKFQELFLTWYVEKVLSKDRIMELYLNGIEYGPGIYGIVDASSYYFGKHPADLDPPEAVFLALMLPSPVKRSIDYCNGELSESMAIKLQRILRLMNERGRLSDLEYELWKEQPIVFDLRRRGSVGSCQGRISRMRAGTFTQMPLSGLLSSAAVLDELDPSPSARGDVLDPDPDPDPDLDLDPDPDLDLDPDPAPRDDEPLSLDALPGSEDPANVDDLGIPAMDR